MSGVGYTVLTNADLTTTNSGIFTNQTGTGGTNTFRVPVGAASQLFFRLRIPWSRRISAPDDWQPRWGCAELAPASP